MKTKRNLRITAGAALLVAAFLIFLANPAYADEPKVKIKVPVVIDGEEGYMVFEQYLGGDEEDPTVTITYPADDQVFTSEMLEVRGSAEDNRGIAKVEVKLNDGQWGDAVGTATWSKTVMLRDGANTIYARASDTAGNTKEAYVTVRLSSITVENGDFETGTLEGWDTTNLLNPTGGRASDPEIVVTDRGYAVYLLSKDQQPYSWWPGSGHIDQLRKVIDGVDYDALVGMEFSVWSKYRGRTSGYLPGWGSKGVVEFRALDDDGRLIKKYSIYYSPRSPRELLEDYGLAIVDWKPTSSYDKWNYDDVSGAELAGEISPGDRDRISKVEILAYVYSFGFIDGDAELWVDDISIEATGAL